MSQCQFVALTAHSDRVVAVCGGRMRSAAEEAQLRHPSPLLSLPAFGSSPSHGRTEFPRRPAIQEPDGSSEKSEVHPVPAVLARSSWIRGQRERAWSNVVAAAMPAAAAEAFDHSYDLVRHCPLRRRRSSPEISTQGPASRGGVELHRTRLRRDLGARVMSFGAGQPQQTTLQREGT